MNILLIEPDKILADNYRQVLERAGYSVNWHKGAQTAIHSADVTKPDLVVLELQLPSHNGIEFLYEFRSYEEWRHIPVIVLSLVPEDVLTGSNNELLERLGVKKYLYKPQTKLSQLLDAVNRITESVSA